MPLTKEEVTEIATRTADEVMERMRYQKEQCELRDYIIGFVVGEGAIPLHGRETRKEPCSGCRIDPDKPLEAGNVMATTEGAIGTLSADEVRNWCSEIIETPDGRCVRVRSIREAAKKCREKYPEDTEKFFECYAPAWSATTKGSEEIWQMTQAEWLRHSEAETIKAGFEWSEGSIERQKRWHRQQVRYALAAGLPVPSKVLADYPELQRQ